MDTRVLPARAAIGKDKGIDQCRWTVRFVSPLGTGVQARRPEAGRHPCTAAARAAAAPASCVDGLHPSQLHVYWHRFTGMMLKAPQRAQNRGCKPPGFRQARSNPHLAPPGCVLYQQHAACGMPPSGSHIGPFINRHSWPGRHLDKYPTKCWSERQPIQPRQCCVAGWTIALLSQTSPVA